MEKIQLVDGYLCNLTWQSFEFEVIINFHSFLHASCSITGTDFDDVRKRLDNRTAGALVDFDNRLLNNLVARISDAIGRGSISFAASAELGRAYESEIFHRWLCF